MSPDEPAPDDTVSWVPEGLPAVFAEKMAEHALMKRRWDAEDEAAAVEVAQGGTATPWAKRHKQKRTTST